MAARPLSASAVAKAKELIAEGRLTRDEIAKETRLAQGTISRIKANPEQFNPKPAIQAYEPTTNVELRKLLKSSPKTIEQLADALDCRPSLVRQAIEDMQLHGSVLVESDGKYEIGESFNAQSGNITLDGLADTSFGAVGDGHLCNKHSRLDVHEAAYSMFEHRGIDRVFHTGNLVDGEAKFNKTELVVRPGIQAQVDYAIDKYPLRKGITTYFIDGDDHEGWWMQREGIQFGKLLEYEANKQGRTDLVYLGYGECDVKFERPNGSACGRIVHPGGGSSYALSYTSQKRVESYTGGEKPQFELAGHYHKFCMCYPREVWCLDTACMCDQTMFMRKKKLAAHVGFTIVNISQAEDGAITQFAPEFFPFYDRKYYEHRF